MSEKVLMKGNEAIAEAAIRANCKHFFGYPITPQNELPAYMARKLPKIDGGVFLQAESEVAASNMVYGAAGAGARVLTSSSSPGISLKAEGISYIAGAELPAVIVNIVRGGPGLGGIQPAQSDYFQATKGMAHGDFKLVVLAPSSVQEAVDLTMEAFDIADRYRNPVMVIGDGIIGQMMEPVEFKDIGADDLPEKDWITDGAKGREKNVINSLHLQPEDLEEHNWKLDRKYKEIKKNEVKYETENMEDAEIAIVAYGTTARIAKTAIKEARAEGIKVGLIRPITLFPFPEEVINQAADQVDSFLTVEMSTGQMVEDVRLAVNGKKPVEFYGRTGGMIPSPAEIVEQLKEVRG
ncbi:2-oxoglutarate ferredoxin oxidoreductase subunit alpha [Candidatus Frackibacter sp. WG11]|uniref:3-methyl-2-oxobutanoate dehydrogenase subunit VorB n=1 Tax=Candidatus Frackibacter sp. WG11 TaxID=2017976 RepID=UPI0008889697|nr:3-methyl-2-oxobutanoate dehydrogenase subunit VorB [Candidatus Frackibacter sp. WG11]SDC02307.1 2-oxoglutarate ferredoxin oxidoreductase subunit alpha [Candidatus Frackibacter sp. WG11]